jgi:hypothetical protein
MELPTMRASEATAIASGLARQLAGEIENVNMKYPTAVLDPTFQDIIDQARAGMLPGPTPADAIPAFERLFLALIARRYVIVPDQL